MEKNSLPQDYFKLIQINAKLIAKNYPHSVNDVRELYFIGFMALKKAEARYSADGGAQFKTYASRCIYNEMVKEIKSIHNVVRLPEKQQERWMFVELNENISNRKDSLEEILVEDGSCQDELWESSLWEEQESDRLKHSRYEALDNVLNELEPENQELIRCHYGYDRKAMTLKELGKAHGVSFQAIHKKIGKIENGLKARLYHQSA